MRLLHVVNLGGLGGMEHLFTNFLAASVDQTTEHVVAVKKRIHPMLRPAIGKTGAGVHGLKHWFGIPIPSAFRLRQYRQQYLIKKANIDRVVFWSTLPDDDWLAALKALQMPFIYYDHGKAWRVDKETLNQSLAGAYATVTVSSAGAAVIRERHGDSQPIRIVGNGIRMDSPVPERHYLPEGVVRVGFAGRLVSKKGMPVALAAAKRLLIWGIPFHLKIAGDGPERSAVESLIQSYGIQNQVSMLGHQRDMTSFYRNIDILVMPSIAEPFGLAALEAATQGAVPLVANIDGMVDTVASRYPELALEPRLTLDDYQALGGTGEGLPGQVYSPAADRLVAPKIVAPDELARRIRTLATDISRLGELGESVQRTVRAHYSMPAYAATLTKALTS